MMSKARFLMLVGLPASGKSTFAKEAMEGREDIVYLSSDELRVELLGDVNRQDANTDVFVEMAKRTVTALKEGKHVIYDATNTSRKKRQGLLGQLPKGIEKHVVYMATDMRDILKRNQERDRTVPESVIERMYKTLQIPIYSEGWDSIKFIYDNEILFNQLDEGFVQKIKLAILTGKENYTHEMMDFLATYFKEFSDILNVPHDSKWHTFSISRHIYYVYRFILEHETIAKNNSIREREIMIWASLLHDIGKFYCKSFINRKGEETPTANYIGHEHVGAQMAISFLKKLDYDDYFIHRVATLIQFHMYLLDGDASEKKLINRVGEQVYEQLKILREADVKAH